MNEHLREREYLGDGVYAGWDGWHVVLWLESPGALPGSIGLEPQVLARLDRYRERCRELREADKAREIEELRARGLIQ